MILLSSRGLRPFINVLYISRAFLGLSFFATLKSLYFLSRPITKGLVFPSRLRILSSSIRGLLSKLKNPSTSLLMSKEPVNTFLGFTKFLSASTEARSFDKLGAIVETCVSLLTLYTLNSAINSSGDNK